MTTFDAFQRSFFDLFFQKQFRNNDFLTYLQRPAPRRAGDEASIVDNTIIGPLLALLGFSHGEQVYNQGNKFGRPDFAPITGDYGVCFVVEDKSTGLELTLEMHDPESNLSQLCRYLRALGLRNGWLTNGKRLMVWRLDTPTEATCLLDLDVANAVLEWSTDQETSISLNTTQALRLLWEKFRKETFADWQRLEHDIALDWEEWQSQALPVGANEINQELLVDSVKTLLQDLQADARNQLDQHLAHHEVFERRSSKMKDDDVIPAAEQLDKLRNSVIKELSRVGLLIDLRQDEADAIRNGLFELQRDPLAYLNTKELLEKTMLTLNAALARKYSSDAKTVKAWSKYDNGLGALGELLKAYGDKAFEWHKRKAFLRHDNRESIEVRENYAIWTTIVQETMLGGLSENQRRDEFALQATYVIFIRLMLIRVCEDKGVLRNRFLSNGGLKHWQENIERYFQFATGNPYEPLLDMAFQNAQNIYAHFFTGRELFNWYTLTRLRFVRVLYQLSRFNFADVDSDLIGTIYNTYVDRPEKKQKGQYYTPPEIVRYILDESGYVIGPGIIGPNKRLIDPACGSGTFLVEAARRLVKAYSSVGGPAPRQLIDRVRENLYGFDLNPFACYLAEVNLLIQVLDLVKLAIDGKTPLNLKRFHVYNVDALAPFSGTVSFTRANTLMAEEMDVVDRIKGRQDEYHSGFGWVVANPPYGAGLTDSYKLSLREWWPSVFYGKPDTYVFFFALGLKLLGTNGRLGFITSSKYLMGNNTANLREQLLTAGRITQIVDLPSSIWKDANVDCALIFLAVDTDKEQRKAQKTNVFSMDVRDKLDKLTAREWQETFAQSQVMWIESVQHKMNIRWTPLLEQIEEACRVSVDLSPATKIQRLGDVTQSMQGIIPYKTKAEGAANLYISPQQDTPSGDNEWKPLLDGSSQLERYGLRVGRENRRLKYGSWLWCPRESKYFELPKILFIRLRNRALYRRLVAWYDDTGFYNRHNFSNIIADDPAYDLKYILALYNSSLLNYWYARQYPNVEVSIVDTRQLPIYPADRVTQGELVGLVNQLLTKNAGLNNLRKQNYVVGHRRDGTRNIVVPYDVLLRQMQENDGNFPVYSLFDAQAAGLLRLPVQCDPAVQVSRVFTPNKHPNTVVLRADQLWLEIDDADIRRYLLNYLSRPQWKGHSWDEISDRALLPEPPETLAKMFAEEERIIAEINTMMDEIAALDTEIDDRVLDLYGIIDMADRKRILGSAPLIEDAELEDDLAANPTSPQEDSATGDYENQ
jgi:type I restriction-modification system DNA methylase subunit